MDEVCRESVKAWVNLEDVWKGLMMVWVEVAVVAGTGADLVLDRGGMIEDSETGIAGSRSYENSEDRCSVVLSLRDMFSLCAVADDSLAGSTNSWVPTL